MTTYSRADDWAGVATSKTSQRVTTSSRRPGAEIRGAISLERTDVVRCETCGGLRMASCWPHSVRHSRDGRLVDCGGREVRWGRQ
jgi:hypothetical protein